MQNKEIIANNALNKQTNKQQAQNSYIQVTCCSAQNLQNMCKRGTWSHHVPRGTNKCLLMMTIIAKDSNNLKNLKCRRTEIRKICTPSSSLLSSPQSKTADSSRSLQVRSVNTDFFDF
jgi:hypothetical protein